MKRLTTQEFIERARKVHGDKYDYSKVEYKGIFVKVPIICPIHGVFYQTPHEHLSFKGCPKCGLHKNKNKAKYGGRKPIYGVGVFDSLRPISGNKPYKLWSGMIERCYSERWHKKRPTYSNCSVCKEWLLFSNFEKWFNDPTNGYIMGYQLDKDILVKGNKVYSPETCCFVPSEINNLFTKRDKSRGNLPIGVSFDKESKKYRVTGQEMPHKKFDTKIEAFNFYKEHKEQRIKKIAENFYKKGLITRKVYNSLLNYKVEIND